MKNREKTPTASESPAATDVAKKKTSKKPVQDEPHAAANSARKIDRPGFDLCGSSGYTHAGTGLGLGNDAFDTPDERRLPGLRPDNKLTIPRWSGPERQGTAASDKKPSDRKTRSAPKTKKGG